MRSLARNIGSALRISTVIQDAAGRERALAHETVAGYLKALRRVFILEELPAWNPHLRSSTELRTTPKFYFVGPSIEPATLRLSAARMSNDLEYAGQVFENLVIRDLLVYSEACGARMSYYRDNSGLEVDAIIEGDDAAWIAIEIKLGQRNLDAAARNLLRFREKIDTRKSGHPNALIIITGGGYAFTRSDGVHVVPIDLLTVWPTIAMPYASRNDPQPSHRLSLIIDARRFLEFPRTHVPAVDSDTILARMYILENSQEG